MAKRHLVGELGTELSSTTLKDSCGMYCWLHIQELVQKEILKFRYVKYGNLKILKLFRKTCRPIHFIHVILPGKIRWTLVSEFMRREIV
jgi:hypothetical protein